MGDIKYGLKELRWVSDPGHAWLEVPTADVNASGYRPSKYSHRSDRYSEEVPGRVSTLTGSYTYLEEDCDVRGFIEATGIHPADVVDYVNHISFYSHTDYESFVRELPHCSGLGYVSPFRGGRA